MTLHRHVFLIAAALLAASCQGSTDPTAPAGPDLHRDRGRTTRPIQEFVAAQGTHCWPMDDGSPGCQLFVPPIQNFVGWLPTDGSVAGSVDYAGVADRWIRSASGGRIRFGTKFEGSVTEQPLDDGRAIVTVVLFTENALSWAAEGWDFTNPLIFGCRAPEVLDRSCRQPALGKSMLKVVFYNTAVGAPLPDLQELFFFPRPGTGEISTDFKSSVEGPLRSAFGVHDGTRGRLFIWETDTVDADGNITYTHETVSVTRSEGR